MTPLKDPRLDIPNGNCSVWRYMAHWKFERLLAQRALFFANANKLSDQYEVSVPASTLKAQRDQLSAQGLQGEALEAALQAFHWECNPLKDEVLVNCWSVSPHESYALWKIYLGGERNGVAIRSTVAKLRGALVEGGDPWSRGFYLGQVRYRRHLAVDGIDRLTLITTKKPFYDFEKELRLFMLDGHAPPAEGYPHDHAVGRTVQVALPLLMPQLYVSPFAEPGYAERVAECLAQSGLAVRLRQSEIRDR